MLNRRDRNEALARGTNALVNGQIDDPQLVKLLTELEDYVELSGAGGDYYHLEPAKRKSDKEAGRVFLVANNERKHGYSQHPLTHRAISATQQLHERNGVPLVNAKPKEQDIARISALLEKYVMPTSIAGIGSGGARDSRSRESY